MSRRRVINPNAAASAGASPGGCVNLAGAADSKGVPALSWPPSRDTLAALSLHHTQVQIGALYGVGPTTVRRLARKLRIDWPQRQGGDRTKPRHATSDWPPSRDALKALVAEGLLQKEIAARYGVAKVTLMRLMKRLRVKPAGRHRKAVPLLRRETTPVEVRKPQPPAQRIEAPVVVPFMPRSRLEIERDRVAGLLNLMPYQDITRTERAMLRERFPMLAKAGRRGARRNVAEAHDPKRAA